MIASIPRYSKVAPAAVIGISYDFDSAAAGMRLSFDVIPTFIDRTRTILRTTLSIAG